MGEYNSPMPHQIVVNDCTKQHEMVGANLMFALYVSLLRLPTQDRTESIILLDEIAGAEDSNGEPGLLDSFSSGQDMSPIQGKEEIGSVLDGGSQDMHVLLGDILAVPVQDFGAWHGHKAPVDLCQPSVEAALAFQGKRIERMKALYQDGEGDLRSKAARPASIKEQRRTTFRGVRSGD